jgi:hypothetical protein
MSSSNYYKLIILFFAFGTYCLSDCAVIDYNNPIAQTVYGQVRGKQYTYSSTGAAGARHVVAFIGVPYARSPTGVDRFLVRNSLRIYFCLLFLNKSTFRSSYILL